MNRTAATKRRESVARDRLGELTELSGVGPARAERFAELGVSSIRDLLMLIPNNVERWAGTISIAEARATIGARVAVRGVVARSRFSRFGRRSIVRVTLEDAGATLDVVFFNQSWLRDRFVVGEPAEVFGRIVEMKGSIALAAQRLATAERPFPARGELVATYPSCTGLAPSFVRELCRAAATAHVERLIDPLSSEELASRDLPNLARAVRALHAPNSELEFERARARVALEPLLELEARLVLRSRSRTEGRAPKLAIDDQAERELVALLGVEPTRGQARAIAEIRADLAQRAPMRRLLQADVGAGKTLVAVFACLIAARAGFQAAFMAPTTLLAEQHFEGTRRLFERAGVASALIVGSSSARERRAALEKLARGESVVAFGTHALFSDDVAFARLGLAVVDEQQRFGVEQRTQLLDKGKDVHALLLTATPIPRTLALTLYGDLELSLMRDRPRGRGDVATTWIAAEKRAWLRKFLFERADAGDRIYWVVPRIGDDSVDDQSGAEQRFAKLARSEFAKFGVELVHGRIERRERARRLERFRIGASRMLVATTVIEVGVDVPEATVMVIEEAERLGLAQLHQLRGRVGRGVKPSWCFLIGKNSAAERFRLLERERDGFAIAEADLRARGMGDLTGLRQAGANSEGLVNVERDLELLVFARDAVLGRDDVLHAYAPPPDERATI